MVSERGAATRQRLLDAALDLFEARGYEATTVEDIASACGVSHMTFFRHFPTKQSVLLDDPYDPLIAGVVAAQPASLPPIERVARGLASAAQHMDAAIGEEARRRIAIAATTPELRPALLDNTRATEEAIVAACAESGTDERAARVAAAACLAALSVALRDWATKDSDAALGAVTVAALRVVAPGMEEVE